MIDAAKQTPKSTFNVGQLATGDPSAPPDGVPLPAESFARLLIASLTLHEANEIDLSYQGDRDRLVRLINEIEEIILEQNQPFSRLAKDLIRIRNQISPSDSGAYDGFEELLTSQQSWIVSRYNPSLDKIKLTIHPDIARHLLGKAAPQVQGIVQRIVGAFMDKSKAINR